MKRFLSWVLLYVGFGIFDFINGKFWGLIFYVGRDLWQYSSALFWVVLILGGSTIFGIIIWLSTFGAALLTKGSQWLRKSAKGTRYVVFSIMWLLFAAFVIIAAFMGFATPKWQTVAYGVAHLIFAVCVWTSGKGFANEDGAPPTKLEELKAKVAKLEAKEKEANNGHNP